MKQECIPVVCIPPTAVVILGVSPYPPEETPPGANTSLEQVPPEQAPPPLPQDRHPLARSPLNFPLGCGPGPDSPQLPPWVWPWTRSPSTSPLGVGLDQMPLNFFLGCGPGNLQGMQGYHPPRPAPRHAGITPPVNRIMDTCENIT